MVSFFSELKRRNVFRMGIAYLAGAWLLVEVADTLFSIYGLPESAARIVVTLLAIGFPITLILSWIYELTPEGLKLERDIDRTLPSPRIDTRRLDRTIIVLLVLALGYFAFDKFVLEPVRVVEIVEETAQQARSEALVESYGDRSIAVLPFVNMSSDPEQEYFSDGISEELLNLLARVSGLRVTARSSSFSYKGKDFKVADVARDLNVGHVLEGSVRKSGNRIRITAQLIEAHSDSHLWSETYDRDLDDIFAIQDEISAAIVEALRDQMGLSAETAPHVTAAVSADAYDAYLKGRDLVYRREQNSMGEAIRHLERAVSLDGNFAPAYAQMAIATMMQAGLSTEDKAERALPLLDRAQELEPDLAEAHGGRALVAYMTGDFEATIEHAQKALAINPNYVDAMHWLRAALADLNRNEEAQGLLEKMLEVDPLSVSALTRRALDLANRGQINEAHALADQLMKQSRFRGARVHAIVSMLYEGKLADSLAWALKAPVDQFMTYWAFLWIGEMDEARRLVRGEDVWEGIIERRFDEVIRIVEELIHADPNRPSNFETIAEAYFYVDRFEEAVDYYERILAMTPEGKPIGQWWNLTVTMNFAVARGALGDEQGAQEIAGIVQKDIDARRAAGEVNMELALAEAMLAAFNNDRELAISALRSAVQHGLPFLVYVDGPVFDVLRDNPEFISLRNQILALRTAEHDKSLQLICFNNPVPDEWQPLKETCKGVSGVSGDSLPNSH